jgi:hypothetical protein
MSTITKKVDVFFYGTFMNPDVLSDYGVKVERVVPAKVGGFELSIRPRANLARSEQASAYGGLAATTHADLDRLYTSLKKSYGVNYLPEPVLAETMDGLLKPALVYIAPEMRESQASKEQIEHLASCVRKLGLPEWYAQHVESFAPQPEESESESE